MFLKNRHSERSFSQCGEDLIVKFFFTHVGLQKVRYLDIGANHPWKFNNTALLYLEGSRGVNIEPDPDLFRMIQKQRKADTNLNAAIDSKEGEVDFFLFEEHTMNTINKIEADKNIHERNFHFRKSVKIKALTLTSVIDTYFQGNYPEFLSIDAEGTDETIVRSLDASRVLPRLICIETVSYTPNITGTKNPVIFATLREKGYRVFADTYVNTIFAREI